MKKITIGLGNFILLILVSGWLLTIILPYLTAAIIQAHNQVMVTVAQPDSTTTGLLTPKSASSSVVKNNESFLSALIFRLRLNIFAFITIFFYIVVVSLFLVWLHYADNGIDLKKELIDEKNMAFAVFLAGIIGSLFISIAVIISNQI